MAEVDVIITVKEAFGRELLPEILECIAYNLAPDEVFGADKLMDWALNNEELAPGDIFSYGELEGWAISEGFRTP